MESCPSGALVFGDLDDPSSEVAALVASGTEVMHPEYAMGEKVTYTDLPKKFVAGTVIYGDVDEVAVGHRRGPHRRRRAPRPCKTNGFGDFEFEGLADATDYTVKIEAPGLRSRQP